MIGNISDLSLSLVGIGGYGNSCSVMLIDAEEP
jgi:hypothetical protein